MQQTKSKRNLPKLNKIKWKRNEIKTDLAKRKKKKRNNIKQHEFKIHMINNHYD